MASCGRNVDDEKKYDEKYDENDEDWSDADLDPDKICDFSTSKRELFSVSGEMLILRDENGNSIDRRVPVFFKKIEFHTTSYFNLCQMVLKHRDAKSEAGSASYIPRAKKPFFLTCAHNLLNRSARTKLLLPKQGLKVYKSRYGKKTYVVAGRVKEMLPHPKYDGHITYGFDIGIFWLHSGKEKQGTYGQNTHGSIGTIKNDVMMHYANHKNLKKGMKVEIAGYPGDKQGYPYMHEGTIIDIQKKKYDGYIIWYDADTSSGNSGSSIMVTDHNFIKSITKEPGIKKIIIGVHSGYDGAEKLNFGTLITEGLYHWIMSK